MQWPFGYGLTYTTFEYKNLKVNEEVSTGETFVSLSFEVKNTGEVAADEIAQVYLSPADGNKQIRPIQLQGFARVALKPGQTRKVKVKMYVEQFGYYTNQGQRQWNVAPGTYQVAIGASSEDIRLKKNVVLKGDPVTKPLRDFYFSECFVE